MASGKDKLNLEIPYNDLMATPNTFDRRVVVKRLLEDIRKRYPQFTIKYCLINPNMKIMVDFCIVYEAYNAPLRKNIYYIFAPFLFTTSATSGYNYVTEVVPSKKLQDAYFEDFLNASIPLPIDQFKKKIEDITKDIYNVKRPKYDPNLESNIRGDYYTKNITRVNGDRKIPPRILEEILSDEHYEMDLTLDEWVFVDRLSMDPNHENYFCNVNSINAFFKEMSKMTTDFVMVKENISRKHG